MGHLAQGHIAREWLYRCGSDKNQLAESVAEGTLMKWLFFLKICGQGSGSQRETESPAGTRSSRKPFLAKARQAGKGGMVLLEQGVSLEPLQRMTLWSAPRAQSGMGKVRHGVFGGQMESNQDADPRL